MKLELLCGNTS